MDHMKITKSNARTITYYIVREYRLQKWHRDVCGIQKVIKEVSVEEYRNRQKYRLR